MNNTITFYEEANLMETIKTNKNITESFVEFKLAKNYEYRKSNKYWADVIQNGIGTRYTLEYGVGLIKGIQYDSVTLEKLNN
jgi:hypothetical protein